MKIGFIGVGWIGKNYADNLERRGYSVIRYDRSEKYKENKEKLKKCRIVFVAVPTPSTPEGFDDSVLIDALKSTHKGQTVVIKSTLRIGTTNKMQRLFRDRYIIHSPEFLTEATAKFDVDYPERNILGYTKKSKNKCNAVMKLLPKAPYNAIVPCKEAEFVKYMGNCYFYAKVLMTNVFYDVAKANHLDTEKLKEMVSADSMVGKQHLNAVHKGGRGAGNHCLLKDLAAFREMYQQFCKDKKALKFIQSMEEYNIKLLKDSGKDLEILKGVYGK